MDIVKSFLNRGYLLIALNKNLICLMPIQNLPEKLSLRLQKILDDTISRCQNASIKGRLITDNILVAFEQIQYMKNCKSRTKFLGAVKIDFFKAYGCISWLFLQEILKYMNFPNH